MLSPKADFRSDRPSESRFGLDPEGVDIADFATETVAWWRGRRVGVDAVNSAA